MISLLFFLLLFQGPAHPTSASVNSGETWSRQQREEDRWRDLMRRQLYGDGSAAEMEEAQRRDAAYAAYQEREFVAKFNQFVHSLSDFAKTYNGEHTINVKKAKAVSQAWRELEKVQGWFKADKK